ncbi:MAG: hypothetical protein KBC22_01025 [Candidatus Pacebacteria bacterium]|nr:hypothetical protein [Candidatus Paceibacterota bacterium]
MEKMNDFSENIASGVEKINDFESEIKGFNLAENVIEQTIHRAEQIIDKESNPETKRKILERLGKYVRRIVGITSIASFGLSLNHIGVHNNDIEDLSTADKTEYVHSDEKSDRILKYITGQEDFSTAEKEVIFKEYISTFNLDFPENFKELSANEIDDQVRYQPRPAKEIYGENWLDSLIPPSQDFDKKYYEAIYKIVQETGSPNIRFKQGSANSAPHYNPLNHTIYIKNPTFSGGLDNIEGNFIAELAHSKQFTEKPIGTYLKAIESGFGMITTFAKEGFSRDLREIQKDEYDKEGSFEYEAHSEIEIDLKKEFKNNLKSGISE